MPGLAGYQTVVLDREEKGNLTNGCVSGMNHCTPTWAQTHAYLEKKSIANGQKKISPTGRRSRLAFSRAELAAHRRPGEESETAAGMAELVADRQTVGFHVRRAGYWASQELRGDLKGRQGRGLPIGRLRTGVKARGVLGGKSRHLQQFAKGLVGRD